MFRFKPSFGWVSENTAMNLSGLCFKHQGKFTSLHIILGKNNNKQKPLKTKTPPTPHQKKNPKRQNHIVPFWLNEGKGAELENPCLLFEHVFVFNYLQGFHCKGTGAYKMLTFLQHRPSVSHY